MKIDFLGHESCILDHTEGKTALLLIEEAFYALYGTELFGLYWPKDRMSIHFFCTPNLITVVIIEDPAMNLVGRIKSPFSPPAIPLPSI
jgi:hypothetical protein